MLAHRSGNILPLAEPLTENTWRIFDVQAHQYSSDDWLLCVDRAAAPWKSPCLILFYCAQEDPQDGYQVDTRMALINWIKLCLSYWLLSEWVCGCVYLCVWKKFMAYILKTPGSRDRDNNNHHHHERLRAPMPSKTWRVLCQRLATPHHNVWLQKPSFKEPRSVWKPDCQIDSMRERWWVRSMTQPWASSRDCLVIQIHTPEWAA